MQTACHPTLLISKLLHNALRTCFIVYSHPAVFSAKVGPLQPLVQREKSLSDHPHQEYSITADGEVHFERTNGPSR
jgi:hypothetical protein